MRLNKKVQTIRKLTSNIVLLLKNSLKKYFFKRKENNSQFDNKIYFPNRI